MKATIKSPFATVKETAAVLGVPASRVKKLVALVHAHRTRSINKNHNTSNNYVVYLERSGSTLPKKQKQRASRKSESRRYARGKRSKSRR